MSALSGRGGGSRGGGGDGCHKCVESGHWSKECPQAGGGCGGPEKLTRHDSDKKLSLCVLTVAIEYLPVLRGIITSVQGLFTLTDITGFSSVSSNYLTAPLHCTGGVKDVSLLMLQGRK